MGGNLYVSSAAGLAVEPAFANMSLPSPGLGSAAERLLRTAFPLVSVTAPAPDIRVERDVAVALRDGTRLRVNVFRPEAPGRFPVLMSAHPYGKDVLPARTPFGYLPLKRYRFIRQPDPSEPAVLRRRRRTNTT